MKGFLCISFYRIHNLRLCLLYYYLMVVYIPEPEVFYLNGFSVYFYFPKSQYAVFYSFRKYKKKSTQNKHRTRRAHKSSLENSLCGYVLYAIYYTIAASSSD